MPQFICDRTFGNLLRWSPQIAEQLEQSRVGIICLTRDNLDAPWILFEAGALSKAKDAYVCTFLLDLQAADVKPPLGQFQHTTKDKADVFALVNTINNAVMQSGERGLTDAVLERIFERAWPDLSTELEHISRETVTEQPIRRTDRELLEEILDVVRTQDRRLATIERREMLAKLLEGKSPGLASLGLFGLGAGAGGLSAPSPLTPEEKKE